MGTEAGCVDKELAGKILRINRVTKIWPAG